MFLFLVGIFVGFMILGLLRGLTGKQVISDGTLIILISVTLIGGSIYAIYQRWFW